MINVLTSGARQSLRWPWKSGLPAKPAGSALSLPRGWFRHE